VFDQPQFHDLTDSTADAKLEAVRIAARRVLQGLALAGDYVNQYLRLLKQPTPVQDHRKLVKKVGGNL
jgi:hypothetical protein